MKPSLIMIKSLIVVAASLVASSVTAESSSSDPTAATSSRSLLRGSGVEPSFDRFLAVNDTNATSTAAAAESCAQLLLMSDVNGDHVVDWKEYTLFVQRLSVDTVFEETAANLSNYFDLPTQLQVTYNRLACVYCFTNGTDNNDSSSDKERMKDSIRAEVAPETPPPTRDDCCVGLDSFADSISFNETVDVTALDEEEVMYLTQMCDATVQAMDEAWTSPDDVTQGRLTSCPVEFSPGTDCSDYATELQCEYGHIYMGCTWDELFCQYIERCDCFDDVWSCLSLAVAPCGIDGEPVPEGLPWGRSCDPDEPLPQPPTSIVLPSNNL